MVGERTGVKDGEKMRRRESESSFSFELRDMLGTCNCCNGQLDDDTVHHAGQQFAVHHD